jgi:hypothetical protein
MPLLLAGLALAIRGLMLRSRFPYIDDLLQLYAVTRPSAAEAAAAVSGIGPLQPPLDYLLGFLAARVTGDLACLRLLPSAWSVMAVVVAYRLGARRHGPVLAAWWAALLAVSLPFVSFSVTLRPYSLAVLLGLLAWSALEDLLDGGKVWPYAVGQSLFQIAYPHAWLVGASQLAFVALMRKPALVKVLRALAPSWLTLAAWLFWWHFNISTVGGFHYDVPWSALALIGRSFSQAQGPGLLLYPALCVLGAAAAWRSERLKGFVLMAAMSLAPPLLAIFAVHRAERVLLLTRHALPLLPAYLGLAAAGCAAAQARASEHSRRAELLAQTALIAVVAWAALGPLLTLARREIALSAYLTEFAQELGRRAGPADILIFADPNTGATLLHALDRRAFDALSAVRMRAGFALFQFPKNLAVAAGRQSVQAFTLCAVDPALATIDAARLKILRSEKAPGRRFWLVTLEGLNALPQVKPFASLGVTDADLIPTEPGLSLLR